jgi:hypothetical protein
MNGRFQMQGGKNWILPKEMNANRFFWDSYWLEIWSNHLFPSMGPNGGSVAGYVWTLFANTAIMATSMHFPCSRSFASIEPNTTIDKNVYYYYYYYIFMFWGLLRVVCSMLLGKDCNSLVTLTGKGHHMHNYVTS